MIELVEALKVILWCVWLGSLGLLVLALAQLQGDGSDGT